MYIYYDVENEELLTEDEMMERVDEIISLEDLHLERVKKLCEWDIWENLNEDFKMTLFDEVFNSVVQERFISRDFGDE